MKIIDKFLEGKHVDYILDLISRTLLGVWIAGFILLTIGLLFNSILPSKIGIFLCIATSGWERIMSYLTWREDELEDLFPNDYDLVDE